jgi:hypothetical protein
MLATRFAAFVWSAFVAGVIYGFFVYRYRSAKEVLIFGFSAFLVGCKSALIAVLNETFELMERSVICMATVKPGTNAVAVLYCCFCGIGFAAPLVYLNMVTQLSVTPDMMGLATALVTSSRSVGGAIGIAICVSAKPIHEFLSPR